MDSSLRNTPALIAKIERLRDELIKHFETLVSRAGFERTDRTNTAIAQYQMHVETAALIRAAEDVQRLIRQLQEIWLFGQLDTMGDSKAQQRTDEDAKAVGGLLQQLLERQQQTGTNGEANAVAVDATTNGHTTNGL